MAIRRLYTGSDGKSYIDDLAVPFAAGGAGGQDPAGAPGDAPPQPRRVTTLWAARTAQVGRLGAGFAGGRHNVPGDGPYLVAFLGPGIVEIETARGWRHRFEPGDLLLCADFTGEGHITRVIGDAIATNLYVVLEAAGIESLVGSAGSRP